MQGEPDPQESSRGEKTVEAGAGASALDRHRWRLDAITAVVCVVSFAALWLVLWLAVPDGWRGWYVDPDALPTLLQVVPATVVAVFIFAVGAVLVIVQIISPTLGSRAIEDLLAQWRARASVIAGIVLLLACLVATMQDEKSPGEASAATALTLAALFYVPVSIVCISSVFHRFVSPSRYSELLGQWRGGSGHLASERAFRQLRALRQWLRTACGSGESRDIIFALRGFQELLDNYCVKAPKKGRATSEEAHREQPDEYSETGEIFNSKWRALLAPRDGRPDKKRDSYWFSDEFGRALARSAEVGIRSGSLLRRDLDRLLVTMGGATLQLADLKPPTEKGEGPPEGPSPDDAGFLLDRIAEIGMYAIQVQDEAYSDWFPRPAVVLASLENKLEVLQRSPEQRKHLHDQKYCLAARSLSAWCLANYAFQPFKDSPKPQGKPTAYGLHRLGVQARINRRLWDEAKKLTWDPTIHPSWMSPVQDEPGGKQHLNDFLKNVQDLVSAKPCPQNLSFADGLDDWIVGGTFQDELTTAHWQDYSVSVDDEIATLCSEVLAPCGDVFLSQVIAAKFYRGATPTFKVHTRHVVGDAEMRLRIFTQDGSHSEWKLGKVITGCYDEVTEEIPSNAEFIQFGLALTGPGRIELCNVELPPTRR